MTPVEMLQDPTFKRDLENRIVRHINDEYMRAGMSPPLPKFRNDVVHYDDKTPNKLANRLRAGMRILAKALDEKDASK